MIQLKMWIKAHKNEIIVGIVVSIITAIILKLGDIILLLVPKAGNSVWGALRDGIFYQAGRFSIITPITALISALAAMGFTALLVFALSAFRSIRQYQLIEKANEIIEKHEKDPTLELTDDELQSIEQYAKSSKNKPTVKKLKKDLVYMLLIGLLLIGWVWYMLVLPAALNQNFERCITQISPYVEETDILMLRSQWVSMVGKADYDEIAKTVDGIREQYNLP